MTEGTGVGNAATGAADSNAGPTDNRHSSTVVVVGASTRGISIVERLAASSPELLPSRALQIILIDPFPAGPGRVWRLDQPAQLQANSVAGNLAVFTDDSVSCQGPIRPGPTLPEWAAAVRRGQATSSELSAATVEEIGTLDGRSFASRRLVSGYLTWCLQHVAKTLPPDVTLHVVRDLAVELSDRADGRQHVVMSGSPGAITADAVVLAVGHLDAEPDTEQKHLRDIAVAQSLLYLPPSYSADTDLDCLRPGEPAIVRGMGLAFVDLLALLTEGRGGKFLEIGDALRYVPSGAEPVLFVGSRRGVPHHAKPDYGLTGELAPARFFDPDALDACLAAKGTVDFASDLWPVAAKELAWAYYHELFAAHPQRTAIPWRLFAARFADAPWGGPDIAALVERAVPDATDRLDLAALDRPLRGARFSDQSGVQAAVMALISADVTRRTDPAHSPDLALSKTLVRVYLGLSDMAALRKLPAPSRRDDVDGWLTSLFKKVTAGPPPARLRQLLALADAGLVRFLGQDIRVRADPAAGVFTAGSGSSPYTVHASTLIDARLPRPTVVRSADRLLRSLYEAGEAVDETLPWGADPDEDENYVSGLLRVDAEQSRIVDRDGRPHPRRFAVGPFTSNRAPISFAFPGINAPALRQNDHVARAVLRAVSHGVPEPEPCADTPDRRRDEAGLPPTAVLPCGGKGGV